jgi:hypothetical protein
MGKKGFKKGIFAGGMAKGFGDAMTIGLTPIEAPQRSGRAQRQAEAQAAQVEKTMLAGANLTDQEPDTFTAAGGPVNYDNTVKARAATNRPRLRKLR